jgi:hypothetical protein
VLLREGLAGCGRELLELPTFDFCDLSGSRRGLPRPQGLLPTHLRVEHPFERPLQYLPGRGPASLLTVSTPGVTGPGASVAGRRRACSAGAVAPVNDELRTSHELRFIGGQV